MQMRREMNYTWQRLLMTMLPVFLVMFLSVSVSVSADHDDIEEVSLMQSFGKSPWLSSDTVMKLKKPKLKMKGTKEEAAKDPGAAAAGAVPGAAGPGAGAVPGAAGPGAAGAAAGEPAGAPAGAAEGPTDALAVEVAGPDGQPITGPDKPRFECESLGKWRITTPNVGVSAMQLQTMPFDKLVWFDTTFLGPSALQWTPPGNCPPNFETNQPDCFVHSLEYDAIKDTTRPLHIKSDPWCSTGSLSGSGTLVGSGGYYKGRAAVRLLKPGGDCDFTEKSEVLGSERWYASQHILDDDNLIIVGGRKSFNYEIIPPDTLEFPIKKFDFPFLQQTTDPVENNLYPFLYLTPEGNCFLFANNRSIVFDYKTAKIIKELPPLPGGSRNYPASGMSAVLPIRINPKTPEQISFDIMVCGGASPYAFWPVDSVTIRPKPKNVYWPALEDCNKLRLMDPNPHWEKDMMLSPRVMGDMLILPTGDLLILNGAKKGAAGWWNGDEPNLTPEIYNPRAKLGGRFKQLTPTTIPRMYHSSSAVLSTGEIFVAGSNENDRYVFEGVPFPTDLRVEKFTPPYLDASLDKYRPKIVGEIKKMTHNQPFTFNMAFDAKPADLEASDLKVTMLYPPFTTHGYSQQQRMLVLEVQLAGDSVTAVAPPNKKIAPTGYYLLFLVYRGVPSTGVWSRLSMEP